MSLARAAAAAAQWGRQGRTGGCGACPAGREGPARAPGGERGDRLRRPRSHAGLPSLWASQQQRGFAIVTDTSDDTHDDFKPKYKGPPVDDAEETIKKDISSHQVFLYMKARGLCVCGGGGAPACSKARPGRTWQNQQRRQLASFFVGGWGGALAAQAARQQLATSSSAGGVAGELAAGGD
jgi:hypothetical protein